MGPGLVAVRSSNQSEAVAEIERQKREKQSLQVEGCEEEKGVLLGLVREGTVWEFC